MPIWNQAKLQQSKRPHKRSVFAPVGPDAMTREAIRCAPRTAVRHGNEPLDTFARAEVILARDRVRLRKAADAMARDAIRKMASTREVFESIATFARPRK